MFIRKIYHAILKRYGSQETKQKIWDKEFTQGKWKYLEDDMQDPIYECLNRYTDKGSVLDLGCGTGCTGNIIKESAYETYTGVDISENAVREANDRIDPTRYLKNRYVASDVTVFIPEQKYSVILFRESIYYLPTHDIKKVLLRYRHHLNANGVFIVRLHDKFKYAGIIKTLESEFKLVEKIEIPPKANILVFA